MPNETLREIADVRMDERQLRPVAVRGSIPLPAEGSFDRSVKALLAKHRGELALATPADELQVIKETDTPVGHVVRYRETRDGIPVFGTEILVAADKAGRVTQIDLTHQPKAVVADEGGSAISAKDALKAATEAAGSPKLRVKTPAPEKVYFPTADALRLAYVVRIAADDPPHDWEIVVDAHTGEVLSKQDLLKHMPDGTGMVFDPNPVVSAGNNTLRDPAATAGTCGFAGTPQATIDAQRVSRTLKDLTLAAGKYTLDGPYVRIANLGAPASTIPQETAATFNYPSSDDRFDAVNVYYHLDTFQRYLQSIGVTTAHPTRIDADPHHDTGSGHGAFYSPFDGGLHFGDSAGCRPDRAEDADCMIHEYGHAIQDYQVPGWGGTNATTGRDETGAMGEGYGDILACLYFSERGGGFQREVFEDWCFADVAGLRRVDGTKVYPTNWAGEVHDDGEIWSAALWNAYRAAGGDSGTAATRIAARDAIVKSVTLSHTLVPATGTMADGAEAVLRTNAALDDYLGKQCIALLDSFHARGILVSNPNADLYIRDAAGDPGVDNFVGPAFWNSPDLWVRHADDGGLTHEAPEFGQDNWFYARVTNRGTATARAFVVTFNVKPWAGTEFTYPGDWLPPISAAVGFDLAPGASTIVKAKWPEAAVPAAGTHACWLASVYTPTDTTATGRHTWESNNLAQKNLTVVDLIPGDSVLIPLQIGNLAEILHGAYRLEIRRPDRWAETPVTLEHRNPEVIERLFHSVGEVPAGQPAPVGVAGSRPVVRFLDPGRVEIAHTGLASAVRMHLGRGSAVEVGPQDEGSREALAALGERTAELVGERRRRTIAFRPGPITGFPIGIQPRSPITVGLRVGAPKEAVAGESFQIDVVQRNDKNEVVGGVTVQVNVR